MIKREEWVKQIQKLFEVYKIVAILGPRQCGKTTIAKEYVNANNAHKQENYFDLENLLDISRLGQPMLALQNLTGLIIIDEIQRSPELFPTLRVLADDDNRDQKFLILGSASRELIKQSSESLAGRIGYLELSPFNIKEVEDQEKLLLRGGFPKSYLAKTDEQSKIWREGYIRTYLEQDIPNLGINIPANQLYRLWMMLSHYHGNIANFSEIGRSLNLSYHTIMKYAEILEGTFMVRLLQPWFENISKRQVKAPKIYLRDSGILHTLLNINNYTELQTSPKLGASWEGFALEQIISLHSDKRNCYFWATHSGAELDLLVTKGMSKIGFEFKYTDKPKVTKSMRIALEELKLEHLFIVIPGNKYFKLDENISVIGIENNKIVDKTLLGM
jgi:predicted AAA+ superfamily ATPase